jgi:hypothetical protein
MEKAMNSKSDNTRKGPTSRRAALPLCSALCIALSGTAIASSHREAPQITAMPRVDGTDFYMFRSYENQRDGYVTLLANYLPLQDAYGGPNYFDLENQARYEIHIDNNGDAREDLTFRFQFSTNVADLKVDAGGVMVSVPLKNINAIGPLATDTKDLNARQTYRLDLIQGDRRHGQRHRIAATDGTTTFLRPADNIGNKSIADYEAYARDHIYDITVPNCGQPGRVFVGQRKEGFVVNLGEVFDLVNLNPLGPVDGEPNTIDDKNITTLALELPAKCLTAGTEPVVGAWTTASIPQARLINPRPDFDRKLPTTLEGGPFVQVSRLGMPLVNEVVIGLKDKDRFNASEPKDDAQFATYVTNPTLPELLEILFKGTAVAPNLFPRSDLVATFLTGLTNINKPASVTPSEMLRLNTAMPPRAVEDQQNLGALAGDTAGFPNGRRPGDDVVDIELRVAMGALIADATIAPNNTAPLTDGATVSAADFDAVFPYLRAPIPGSPNDATP